VYTWPLWLHSHFSPSAPIHIPHIFPSEFAARAGCLVATTSGRNHQSTHVCSKRKRRPHHRRDRRDGAILHKTYTGLWYSSTQTRPRYVGICITLPKTLVCNAMAVWGDSPVTWRNAAPTVDGNCKRRQATGATSSIGGQDTLLYKRVHIVWTTDWSVFDRWVQAVAASAEPARAEH